MDLQERLLYHQVHPLKIAIDASAGAVALAMLWQHLFLPAMLMVIIPSTLATSMLVRRGNLEPVKQSALGQYVARYMTLPVELARSGGFVVMIVGAWNHMPLVIGVGLLIIAAAWLSGVFFPSPERIGGSAGDR